MSKKKKVDLTPQIEVLPNQEKEEEKEELILIKPKTTRRLLAEFADICLASILSMFLFFAFKPMLGYDSKANEYASLSASMIELSNASYLTAQDEEGTSLTDDELRANYISALVSYYEDRSASTTNDILANYYCIYVSPNASEPLMSFEEYSLNILEIGVEGSSYGDLFQYDKDDDDNVDTSIRPILSDVMYEAYKAEAYGEADELQGSYVTRLRNFFDEKYGDAWYDFLTTEPYYSNMEESLNLLSDIRYIYLGAALCSYVTAMLLVFLLVPMIKLSGNGIGKKAMRMAVLHENGQRLKWYEILARFGVELLEYVFIVPLTGFLSVGFTLLSVPMFTIFGTTIGISVLAIAGAVVTIASALFMGLTKKAQSFQAMASNSCTYDMDPGRIAAERSRRNRLKDGYSDGY